MRVLDLFSGIGGFRLGFEMAGAEIVGHVEYDKYAQKSYKAIFSHGRGDEYDKEYCGWDIEEVEAGDLPRADIWTFGAPCQDFSVSGGRAGLDGDRSDLVRQVFRLVRETSEEDRPEWLIYENVKGMLSSNDGWDYFAIITEMDDLGYDVEWQLFNSKDYGVPQYRERVYTVGHLRSKGERKIFPITGECGEAEIQVIAHRDGFRRNLQTFSPDGLTETLDTAQGGGRGHYVLDGRRIRRLTPLECWRLQGFPDWAHDQAKGAGLSDTQLYKQAGNSVSVPVAERIARRILNV